MKSHYCVIVTLVFSLFIGCSTTITLVNKRTPSSIEESCLSSFEQFIVPEDSRNFSRWIDSKNYYLLSSGMKESEAFSRVGAILEGNFRPKSALMENDPSKLILSPTGKLKRYNNREYIEFTNSTALQTISTQTKKKREFILTRGVRPYKTIVNFPSGSISPQGYVSDVLLFEHIGDQYLYVNTILESTPEKNFLFEDPRISFLIDKDEKYHFFLSGTDYSPHVQGSKDPDVMNRYTELEIDENGTPIPLKLNADNKEKLFSNLSPSPIKKGNEHIFIDAKNATIYQNERSEIVVRTRMRPDFNNPLISNMAGDQKWKYAEQIFIFIDFKEFQKYDWNFSLDDLFKTDDNAKSSRVRPLVAKTIIQDHQLKEMYKGADILPQKGKGMGPGTLPVRLRREGNRVYLSDTKRATENLIGEVSEDENLLFPLKEGEVKYITFDHEIRYFNEQRDESQFVKRHYTTSVKLFDERISTIEAYYADVIQPTTLHERGLNSGIADLQHIYPMGRTIISNKNGNKIVRVYAGASDAHTTAYDFDMMKLLREFSINSTAWNSGQIYHP